MYDTDQRIIETWAKGDAARTAHVTRFVLVSIRRRFCLVERVMLKHPTINGTAATRAGLDYVRDFEKELVLPYAFYMSDVQLLEHYAQIPGVGIAKAGFCAQLLHGRIGCLDTHNLRMLGLDEATFNTSRTRIGTFRKRADVYAKTCLVAGGSATLWDTWCTFIAKKYPSDFATPDHVSHAHVTGIVDTF